jgi:hypothetical protein
VNKTQLQTTLAPIIAAAAGFLAGKGYFGLNAVDWTTILGSAAAIVATGWGAVAARKTSLADTLGQNGTIVVTDKKTADALPANNSVVSNTDMKVVSK